MKALDEPVTLTLSAKGPRDLGKGRRTNLSASLRIAFVSKYHPHLAAVRQYTKEMTSSLNHAEFTEALDCVRKTFEDVCRDPRGLLGSVIRDVK